MFLKIERANFQHMWKPRHEVAPELDTGVYDTRPSCNPEIRALLQLATPPSCFKSMSDLLVEGAGSRADTPKLAWGPEALETQ